MGSVGACGVVGGSFMSGYQYLFNISHFPGERLAGDSETVTQLGDDGKGGATACVVSQAQLNANFLFFILSHLWEDRSEPPYIPNRILEQTLRMTDNEAAALVQPQSSLLL